MITTGGQQTVQGLEHYQTATILVMVREHVEAAVEGLLEYYEHIEIVDIVLIGSRVKGTATDESDLDVLVEYRGDVREEGFFESLNSEEDQLEIDGIVVDFNPITLSKSGTISSWLARNGDYTKAA